MSKCNSLAGRILGHKYSARFDHGSAPLDSLKADNVNDAIAFVHAVKPATYVYDICERCGDIVNRRTP